MKQKHINAEASIDKVKIEKYGNEEQKLFITHLNLFGIDLFLRSPKNLDLYGNATGSGM